MYCMVCCVVIQKKILDDIHKRVDCFAAQWKNKKLSDPVKLSMTRLVDGTGDKYFLYSYSQFDIAIV